MRRVDGIPCRVNFLLVSAALDLLLRAVVVTGAERLEITALEREVGVLADGDDVIDDGGGSQQVDRTTEATPRLVDQNQRCTLIAPPAKVVESRHGLAIPRNRVCMAKFFVDATVIARSLGALSEGRVGHQRRGVGGGGVSARQPTVSPLRGKKRVGAQPLLTRSSRVRAKPVNEYTNN
jgi:hypothetical protein